MAVSASVEEALFVSTSGRVVFVPQGESVIPSVARESGDYCVPVE